IDVALQYIDSWLQGTGAVAIYNLMEDAATAEISRAELWQWVHYGAHLDDGRKMTPGVFSEFFEKELQKLGGRTRGRLKEASELLSRIVLNAELADFLTVPAYEILTQG